MTNKEFEQKLNNLHKLDSGKVKKVLLECIEILGLVSQTKFIEITKYNKTRQSLVNNMKSDKINNIKIGNILFPYIN